MFLWGLFIGNNITLCEALHDATVAGNFAMAITNIFNVGKSVLIPFLLKIYCPSSECYVRFRPIVNIHPSPPSHVHPISPRDDATDSTYRKPSGNIV